MFHSLLTSPAGTEHSCCSEPAIAPKVVIAAAPSGEVIGATSIAREKFAGVYEALIRQRWLAH